MRLNLLGVVTGIASGFLVAALVAVAAWAIGLALGTDDPTGPITVGAFVGALGAGYVAGRLSRAAVFNAAAAGVLFTGAITMLSVLDGSPATTGTIGLFVVMGLVLGAVGGAIAHRRSTRQS